MSEPLFDTSRRALSFALNHHRTKYAVPLMTKMMAEIQLAERPKKKRKGKEEPEPQITTLFRRSPNPSLKGLDGAAQAGMILLHFAKLSDVKRHVLTCAVLRPTLPCSCRSPCCSGFKANPEFVDALLGVCVALKDEAEHRRAHGKRGLKVHPIMHKALVEKHYEVPGRRIILSELADQCNVSEATVVAHRKYIEAFLEQTEKDGWTNLDVLLTKAGIVGVID